tara:strand:- start:813 stop:1271 length:459 start_codon:yes stop_codon:yes gene_type:complete
LVKLNRSILKINVGHVLNKSVGFVKLIEIDEKLVSVSKDVVVNRLLAKLKFTNTHPGILVSGEIDAKCMTECIRCLVHYENVTQMNVSELYTVSNHEQSEFQVDDKCILDLGPLFRELLLVEEPIRVLCQQDCKGLCVDCGVNLNSQSCKCD